MPRARARPDRTHQRGKPSASPAGPCPAPHRGAPPAGCSIADACVRQAHPALEAKLVQALTVLPPQLRAARAAEADVVAATIEAALVKLSLVRARAHRALYGYAPTVKGGAGPSSYATVAGAVSEMYARLKDRQHAQEAEMEGLDRQISDYEGMLSLVDGTDGSFAQVVRDMARVKRETEECRKDLRRLGWTGD